MSMTSIGGDAAQRWQILKESRASPSAGSIVTNAAGRPRPQRAPPSASSPAASANASGASTGTGDISSASAKVIADMKALFISLQSGASGAGGSSGAGTGAAPASTDAASGPRSVQSELQSLFSDLAKVGGPSPHHQPYADVPGMGAPDSTTGAAAAAGEPEPKHSGGLLDEILGALKAYAASATGNAVKGGTALSA